MKKKYIILVIILILLITLVFVILHFTNNKSDNKTYVVKVNIVDDRSPDRTLTVYENNKKIEFKEIRYLNDDVRLCTYKNPTVFFGDLEGEKELKIILTNDKEVVAKIEEEK